MILASFCRSARTVQSYISKELYRFKLQGTCATEISSGCVRFSSTQVPTNWEDIGCRSPISKYVVTVFGATGFLGRYVTQKLAQMGSQVFVPYRGSADQCKHLKLMGDLEQVVPVKFDVRDEDSIKAVMAMSNIVVNLIGRDYESHKFSFQELNVEIPERISRLAQEHGGIARFIQVSALGASPENPAPHYRTKAAGEEVTRRNFPEATIMRPAHLVGTEDRLLNKWAVFAKKLPTVPIIGDGSNKFQPAHVTDVAAAIVAAAKGDCYSNGKTFELGGPDVLTVNELVSLVYEAIKEDPPTLHIPYSVARLISTPEDIFKSIPSPTPKLITFSRNNIESLRKHYVVSHNALTFSDLGIQPKKIEGEAIEHLSQYRTIGPVMDSSAGKQTSGAGF